jgi:hypothetical protein
MILNTHGRTGSSSDFRVSNNIYDTNVQNLTSLNLELRTTIMTPVKLQIYKISGRETLPIVGYKVLQQLYANESRAFVKRVKSFVLLVFRM